MCFPLLTLLLGCNLAFGASSDKVDVRTSLTVALSRLVGSPGRPMASRGCGR